MTEIKDKEYGGERPLFAESHLHLENVTFHAGESALKACNDIVCDNCRFEGKYPFWHCDGFTVRNSLFTEGARAALWYSRGCVMTDTLVDAPKMFRELDGIVLRHVNIPHAHETMWHCRNVKMNKVIVREADYMLMHGENVEIDDYEHDGNYSFQYCRNMTIKNAEINSKDALWNTEDVTVTDSTLDGEYLGWYSRNLRLVRCRISGTQPLCYCSGLVLEDCEFDPSCDLAFEDSEVEAVITSPVTSVKNPRTGSIKAYSIGEVIIDKNVKAPADCVITTEN